MAENHDKPKASTPSTGSTGSPQAGSDSPEEGTQKIDWETVPDKTGFGEGWKNDIRDFMIQSRKDLKNADSQENPNPNHLPFVIED